MKKIYLLPFLLVFSICLAAQNNTFQKHETDGFRKEIAEIKTNSLLDETILDSIVYYQFDNELDSVRSSKKEYDRYESGEVKTRFEYLWDQTNNQWVYFEKRDYSFDDNGNLTFYNIFRWDIDQTNWVNYRKIDFTYDENGYDESTISLKWNIDLSRWDKDFKEETDYDENGNLLLRASVMSIL